MAEKPSNTDGDSDNWDWAEGEPERPIPPRRGTQPFVDPRINFHLAPGDVMVECPYDRQHLVRQARLIVHLNKCRRNYTMSCHADGRKVDVMICKYDWTHHYHELEIAAHERSCPQQPMTYDAEETFPTPEPEAAEPSTSFAALAIADQKAAEGSSASGPAPTMTTTTQGNESTTVVDEEWWESDPNVGPDQPYYDPNVYIERHNIPFIPVPPGLPRSMRRAYREQQTRNYERRQRELGPTGNAPFSFGREQGRDGDTAE